ncbi:MAG: branched-chain amino acid ABC transporter permease [Alphaproteobacteria bacterium]|jgi:branched-chain amino acid transport system permease protein|nr:branched-chain amino acid ABC transporter permease [Alphaproteobacteria bacterium]MBT4085317.1 branched-chain amino acid ABC transporter permease [Alphaproteobacteria bacterium]MBT4544156.1 branched-chain amino acid ABC transporter permease [Alphaproteobacteria bacterium]MBT7744270.1 branched-chain amino acid ABC transporter permease [Alphaproteobacteria bacterium]
MDNISLLTMAPVLNVQLLVDGLLIGAIFALVAYGLALVWGVTNVKNLAQGDFVMMGGYIAYAMTLAGIHPFLALPVAIVLMFAFGWLIYKTVIYRVVDKDLFTSLLATFGIAIVVQQLLNLIFGPEVKIAESGFGIGEYLDGGLTVSNIKVIAFFLALALALVVVLFMKKSRMGQAIRATSQNARAARIMGIDTDKVYAITFALNAAICGAAGVLISMIWVIQPYFGTSYSIRAFVIVTAAGLGNLPGVIMAGLGLGALEQFGSFILGAEFQQAIVVGLLLVILVIRQIQQSRHRQVVK